MKDRAISKQEVEQCIKEHDTDYADTCGNPIYVGTVNGRRIKVVIQNESKDPIWVITAAEKDDKFW
jgi:hypothetical protein